MSVATRDTGGFGRHGLLCGVLAVVSAASISWTGVAGPPGGCAPAYDIEIVCGPQCSGSTSAALSLGINAAGDIVGQVYAFCFPERAFVWKAGTATMQLLPMPQGTLESRAEAINDSGQIVGSYAHAANSGTHGFLISNGVFTNMGVLPGGNRSEALDINNAGVAVGFWGNIVIGPSPQAMSWSSGTMSDLMRYFRDPYATATAINDAGLIVGTTSSGPPLFVKRAFLLNGRRLTVLPPVEGTYGSFGAAVNELGQVAGSLVLPCDPPQRFCAEARPFFWNGSEMIDLGTLPGYPDTKAYSLNDAGQIVGHLDGGALAARAFLWESGTMYILDDLVDPAALGGEHIAYAHAINQAGQIACSITFNNGQCVARLTPRPRRVSDLDCDGSVGGSDLSILLGQWGSCAPDVGCASDLDGDGQVAAGDLAVLLGAWTG